MKLIQVLERNAHSSMEVTLVNGDTITASSWTVGPELLEAHKQKGFSIYIPLDKIMCFKATA